MGGYQRGITFHQDITLVTEMCCACGVMFAIPDSLQNQLVETRQYFYCPNGHSQNYVGKTDKQRLAEEQRRHASTQEELRVARIEAMAAEKKARAKVRTLEKKALATQCLHCPRTIDPARMRRHVETKHPGVLPERVLP